MKLFGKKISFKGKKKIIPDGLWVKCPKCSKMVFNKELYKNLKVCPYCEYHFNMTAWERIESLADEGTFVEYDAGILPEDPLEFEGPKTYKDKLREDQQKTGLKDAAVCGICDINGISVTLSITDTNFIMGSMGSVVGEKITRNIERGLEKGLPVIIVSGSGGGARMYEGCLSLMQMAKTSAALQRLSERRIPFISVLTHPTMAGIMASFASLGDVIIAEPEALIGFTGPRVIKQTIKQELPPGFQRSEFMLTHGQIDIICRRKFLKDTISDILNIVLNNKPAISNTLA